MREVQVIMSFVFADGLKSGKVCVDVLLNHQPLRVESFMGILGRKIPLELSILCVALKKP